MRNCCARAPLNTVEYIEYIYSQAPVPGVNKPPEPLRGWVGGSSRTAATPPPPCVLLPYYSSICSDPSNPRVLTYRQPFICAINDLCLLCVTSSLQAHRKALTGIALCKRSLQPAVSVQSKSYMCVSSYIHYTTVFFFSLMYIFCSHIFLTICRRLCVDIIKRSTISAT